VSLQVVIDNRGPFPARLRELLGIECFGDLRYKRRTLSVITKQAIHAAGLGIPFALDGPEDLIDLEERIKQADPEERYLICPAAIVAGRGPDVLTLFLKQARYSPQNLVLPAEGGAEWSGWALLTGALFRVYLADHAKGNLPSFFERHRYQFVRLEERLGLIDLSDEVTLLEFLSGTFDARFFNEIQRDAYTIKKTSTDRTKLKREYTLFELLPPRMQMFFIRPFDFTDDGTTASYRMERLFVPDMAVQWLHGAFTQVEFSRFLDHVLHFVTTRVTRPAQGGEAAAAIEALFVTKVRERVEAIIAAHEYTALKPLIDQACGGLSALFARYLALLQRWRSRLPTGLMAIGHGDLCFSNILYAKSSQTMKLIDPRGAAVEADLWTHPYYDIAKLSHSVSGNYDFVNQDMFEVQIDESLRPRLILDRAPDGWASAMFVERLPAAGFDPDLVRLCEASLFISMLPLHVDRPRKVLGFVLLAIGIVEALEKKT
jgi:hypothetical protein